MNSERRLRVLNEKNEVVLDVEYYDALSKYVEYTDVKVAGSEMEKVKVASLAGKPVFTIIDETVAAKAEWLYNAFTAMADPATTFSPPEPFPHKPSLTKERIADILEAAADKLLVDGWTQGAYHRTQNHLNEEECSI